jgi:tetratricopeptide (TPR) repeat protein
MKSVKNGNLNTWKALQDRGRVRWALGSLLVILLLLFPGSSLLANTSDQKLPPKEAVLQEARGLIDHSPTNQTALRQAISLLEGYKPQFPDEIRFPLYLAEAYYRLADPSADVSREFPYYEKTATYAQRVLEMNPNRIEAHYWYGLFLLKKAQKRGISGYFTVKRGIAELEKVRQAMPAYDHAGASRVLGLLYSLAPSWTPFGNLDKSVALGQEAARLAPDYVLNRLYLADAYRKRGNKAAAIREYQATLTASANVPGSQAEGLAQQARNRLRALGQPI